MRRKPDVTLVDVVRIADYFDRIYVVNLVERVDRRREMEAELRRAGIRDRAEFFPAFRPDDAGDWPSVGALGCFMSHYTIAKRARDEGLANVLVMEDDLEIDRRLASCEQELIAQLDRDPWDIAFFGHRAPTRGASIRFERTTAPLQALHFYALNRPVMPRVVDFLELVRSRPAGHPDGGPMHVDGAYTTFRVQNPDVVTLVSAPSLGRQRSSRSDVTPKWYDEVRGLRGVARAARRARGVAKTLIKRQLGR